MNSTIYILGWLTLGFIGLAIYNHRIKTHVLTNFPSVNEKRLDQLSLILVFFGPSFLFFWIREKIFLLISKIRANRINVQIKKQSIKVSSMVNKMDYTDKIIHENINFEDILDGHTFIALDSLEEGELLYNNFGEFIQPFFNNAGYEWNSPVQYLKFPCIVNLGITYQVLINQKVDFDQEKMRFYLFNKVDFR